MKKNIIFTLLLFTSLSFFAEVRYVSKTGSSTAPYTSWETACDSLQKCFDYCNNGDTVYIDRGVYRESIYINAKNLSIIGIDTDECIIDGTGIIPKNWDACFSGDDSKLIIKGLTVKKTEQFTNKIYSALFFNNKSLIIENCRIDSSTVAISTCSNCFIKNNIFFNNGMALDLYTLSDPLVFEIYNNYIQVKQTAHQIGGIYANWGG